MIDLYYWPTPNGWKISIALEELALPYETHFVNIGRGEQFAEEFLRISPNNRIPAIVDRDASGGPLSIFESGAILTYLAEKSLRLMPTDVRGRVEVLQWLFWQVGGLGPMTGQCNHFRNYAPAANDYGVSRYTDEVNRLYGVMDRRLADREFLAGAYSIADIASWPWIVPWKKQGQNLEEFPHLRRWFEAIRARPAVQRGFELGRELRRDAPPDEKARSVLFGQRARS